MNTTRLGATILCSALVLSAVAQEQPKPASEATKKANAAMLAELPFGNKQDFEDAHRGFIAPLPDEGVVKNDKGDVVYDAAQFELPLDKAAPDTVNPSFWRISQLNGINGLFKVVDGIYQVRGADLSVISFIEGKEGVTIVDPLVSAETAKMALDLYAKHRPGHPVKAVIYTHSHVDHFGGVRGIVSEEDVKSGKVKIYAPTGFTEEAVSENVMAGNAMSRRASYMYGNVADKGEQGSLGTGLGPSTSSGNVTLLLPTDLITTTGEKKTIDGLEYQFLMAPGSEAPAEMMFFIPELKAFCPAEDCTHTLHNFYTLRGAKTRDSRKWVTYLTQAIDMWGAEWEVMFAPHHWPTWGNARITEAVEKYRDAFKYIHDQSLHLANQGYTMLEIAEKLKLPPELAANWATRGYYGSVSHNSKAVYNLYLGFFSGNPADLHPLPPAESAGKYVDAMGGADAVVGKAQKAYDAGDYRWVAELLKQVVYADPGNRKARNLQADAFEQLGYQAESGPWRNFYLSGAKELRDGVKKTATPDTASADIERAMSLDQIFDYLAIRLDGPRAAGREMTLNFKFTDTNQDYTLQLKNGVLNAFPKLAGKPDATYTLTRADLDNALLGQSKIEDLVKEGRVKVEGEPGKVSELLGLLDTFDFWFDIITPNPDKAG
ncbi:MAG: MBL fold metallo-hydrolase [Chthoniobacterales bacterium]|nr:MBL fold metallo-hydrolase [Chthoniobacterales bacterium]